MRRVIDFIEENLCDALTVEKLAAVAGYSKYHFVRIFVEETGLTPADYIR
ncbi:MAG: AraC family transcriptional regulator, partial [Lachnospiraceae bacterium]|nr:AraC family transcriptional regulator [Lachnospiraceae bacterium]